MAMSDAEKYQAILDNIRRAEAFGKSLSEFLKTPQGQAKLQELAERSGKNGFCIADGCGGRIIRRVCGMHSDRYIYSLPYCEKCRQKYPFAGNVTTVGHKEFKELMNTPFTI